MSPRRPVAPAARKCQRHGRPPVRLPAPVRPCRRSFGPTAPLEIGAGAALKIRQPRSAWRGTEIVSGQAAPVRRTLGQRWCPRVSCRPAGTFERAAALGWGGRVWRQPFTSNFLRPRQRQLHRRRVAFETGRGRPLAIKRTVRQPAVNQYVVQRGVRHGILVSGGQRQVRLRHRSAGPPVRFVSAAPRFFPRRRGEKKSGVQRRCGRSPDPSSTGRPRPFKRSIRPGGQPRCCAAATGQRQHGSTGGTSKFRVLGRPCPAATKIIDGGAQRRLERRHLRRRRASAAGTGHDLQRRHRHHGPRLPAPAQEIRASPRRRRQPERRQWRRRPLNTKKKPGGSSPVAVWRVQHPTGRARKLSRRQL